MSANDHEALLESYKRELTYLRKMGAEFARQYPKVAGRLELEEGECADPHVERLLEAFAFLTARIQYQIDSEFPEITSALLGILYPQLLNPVPSMAIARFDVDPTQGKLTTGHLIKKDTPLFAQAQQGLICRFRTCYPVTLWPVKVAYAGLESTAQFDFLDAAAEVATVLRLRLECQGGSFKELTLRRLRFYLNGDWVLVNALYELLGCHVLRLAILPQNSKQPVFLPEDSIVPVGFAPQEDVLPYPLQAHGGYRLLQEYFTFPEQFLFFDIDHLDRHASDTAFDLLIMLDQVPRERLVVDRNTFVLGCTPIINLFRKTSEPLRLDQRKLEYRLVADMRRERTTEIHSLLSVSAATDSTDDTKTFMPFYSFNHQMEGGEHKAFWHARRLPTGRKDLPGTDMFLSFLDLDFKPSLPATQTVFAHTLCTNRDLAEQLPAGALLQIEEAAPLARVSCLSKPTPQLDPPLGGQTLWQLISHLSLNYLSLAEGEESLQALREILRLYSFSDRPSTYQQIMGIRGMACRPVVRRIGTEAWRGFCRGIEVTLTFDERLYVGSSPFLFASVLNHFLALYGSVNSFTQLVIKSRQREGIWKQWQPMAGEQIVL
ncbi:MAG: type VI secretion system baseplate subunit TssF [Nitrospinae bacterium]|nr:type VI secretion system baseplate subunit TssF [Nitrospinota bacterium]